MPRGILVAAIAIIASIVTGCSDDNTGVDPNQPNPNVTISITPERGTILAADTLAFTASITGTTNTGVEWSAFSTSPNYGFISPDGIYKAPATISGDSIIVVIEATASANRQKVDSAIVIVKPRERITPNSGSSYSYSEYSVDSSGIKIPGSDKGTTTVVANRWVSYGGMDSIVVLTEGTTPVRVRYESNGDLLYGYPSNAPGSGSTTWIRHPFGSREDHTVTDDTSYADGVRYLRTITASYDGSEMMMVGSQQLTVHRTHVRITEERTGMDGYMLVVDRNYWFAPAIGWFVKESEMRTLAGTTGMSKEGFMRTMNGYTLR